MSFFGLVLALLGTAYADECGDLDAPYGYTLDSCNDICAHSGISIHCQLYSDYEEDLYDPELYGTSDYAGVGSEFVFWGTDTLGVDFCCAFDEESIEVEVINLIGSGLNDLIMQNDPGGSSWLADPGGTEPLVISVSSSSGDDEVHTTNDTSVDLVIYAGADDDALYCNAACTANGQEGSDTIVGSPFFDHIWGGENGSTAGDLADYIDGGGLNDEIHGQNGNDVICGGSGNDTLYGEQGSDVLWGGSGTDSANGSSIDFATDACSAEIPTNCDSTIFLQPVNCP